MEMDSEGWGQPLPAGVSLCGPSSWARPLQPRHTRPLLEAQSLGSHSGSHGHGGTVPSRRPDTFQGSGPSSHCATSGHLCQRAQRGCGLRAPHTAPPWATSGHLCQRAQQGCGLRASKCWRGPACLEAASGGRRQGGRRGCPHADLRVARLPCTPILTHRTSSPLLMPWFRLHPRQAPAPGASLLTGWGLGVPRGGCCASGFRDKAGSGALQAQGHLCPHGPPAPQPSAPSCPPCRHLALACFGPSSMGIALPSLPVPTPGHQDPWSETLILRAAPS